MTEPTHPAYSGPCTAIRKPSCPFFPSEVTCTSSSAVSTAQSGMTAVTRSGSEALGLWLVIFRQTRVLPGHCRQCERPIRHSQWLTWSSSATPSSLGMPSAPHSSNMTLASDVVGGVWFSFVVVRRFPRGFRSYGIELLSNTHSKAA